MIILIRMCVCVTQSYLTLRPHRLTYQAPLSMGFFQARILQWVGCRKTLDKIQTPIHYTHSEKIRIEGKLV